MVKCKCGCGKEVGNNTFFKYHYAIYKSDQAKQIDANILKAINDGHNQVGEIISSLKKTPPTIIRKRLAVLYHNGTISRSYGTKQEDYEENYKIQKPENNEKKHMIQFKPMVEYSIKDLLFMEIDSKTADEIILQLKMMGELIESKPGRFRFIDSGSIDHLMRLVFQQYDNRERERARVNIQDSPGMDSPAIRAPVHRRKIRDREEGMKSEEHNEQAALIDYAAIMANKDPRWSMLFAIPNGGKRHIITAQRLKKEGAKAGVPDLMLAVPCGKYNGMFIEMKSTKGNLTETQDDWLRRLSAQGYHVFVAYGFEHAREAIREYLALNPTEL